MLGDSDGVTLIKDLLGEFPQLKILVISAHNDPLFAERSLEAGALGFLTKEEPGKSIFVAIESVMNGRFAMTESLASSILKRRLKNPNPGSELNIASLSDRELRVFTLLGKGLTSRQISVQLKASIKTVDAHREHIKGKLMFENSAHHPLGPAPGGRKSEPLGLEKTPTLRKTQPLDRAMTDRIACLVWGFRCFRPFLIRKMAGELRVLHACQIVDLQW
jgi:DNA-binding NarL/FixJ family response regulator